MTAGNVPYIFTSNTTAVSAQVNANFAALVTDLNGIDGGQITAGSIAIARLPIITLAKGGSGSDLSATGPGVLVQASNAAVVTVSSQLALARGGSAADLSATGPGLLSQATLGAAVTIASPGQFPATATNDSAAAGKLGEFVTNNNLGAPVTLASGAPSTLTTLTLTAGDWDVWGTVIFNSSAGMSDVIADVNASPVLTVSATRFINAAGVASYCSFPTSIYRLSAAGGSTMSLLAQASFAGTVTASGLIFARRAR